MLFPIGTKVMLIHSNEKGTVKGWMDGQMLRVQLEESGMEIPVFETDLKRLPEEEQPISKVKAKIVPGKKAPQPPLIEHPPIESQYIILKELGIQLAFEPKHLPDNTVEKYIVHLINDTKFDALFDVEIYFDGNQVDETGGRIKSLEAIVIDELLYDELNELPAYQFFIRQITTEGITNAFERTIKIKPKSFFTKKRIAPIINKEVHHYRVLKSFEPDKNSDQEDLKTYTEKNLRYLPNDSSEPTHFDFNQIDIEAIAAFIPEIDLHIEQLEENFKSIPKNSILNTQLQHLRSYLNKAIRYQINRVFIIHGLGEGKLKKAVFEVLKEYPEIQSYKNDYHPKYGFGATEVRFV